MKFIKKPSIIDAEIFDGNPTDSNIQFRQVDNVWQIYNKLHDSWINIKIGDFYRTDIEGDYYPIDADYMKKNYEVVK